MSFPGSPSEPSRLTKPTYARGFAVDRLVLSPARVAPRYQLERWGVAVGTEAQWCHHFEFSDISGKMTFVSSWNNVSHPVRVLA